MTSPTTGSETTLQVRRTFAAPRERVFRAWTDAEDLKKWWGAGEQFSAPIAEVDLRVGGSYRLAMKSPDSPMAFVCTGTYRQVSPPAKLVFTWAWEAPPPDAPPEAVEQGKAMASIGETLVTVEFHDRGSSTEVVLTHERFPDENMRDEHKQGWNGCFTQLARFLE